MDSYPLAISGGILASGGLFLLIFCLYATVFYSVFITTEVIISLLTVLCGVYLAYKSYKIMAEPEIIRETADEPESGSVSPFYFELEPAQPTRDLPPLPKDIGREYDPMITDKV